MSKKKASGRSDRWLHILVAALSFGLLTCAYPPLNWTGLIFVAAAPWFAFAAANPQKGYWAGYLTGMFVWGGALLYWLASLAGAKAAGHIGWIIVSVVFLVLSWPFGWAMRHLIRRTKWPMALIVPLAMTAFDGARRLGTSGIAWHDPGYMLHEWTQWIQVADVARVYPLSFLLWAINGLVADIILLACGSCRGISKKSLGMAALGCGIGLTAILTYGHYRLEAIRGQMVEGPKICGIQPNIPQEERLVAGENPAEKRYLKCLSLMTEAASQENDIDLFVWPETSFFRVDDSQVVPGRLRRGYPLHAILNKRRPLKGKSVAQEFLEVCAAYSALPKFLMGVVAYDDMPVGEYDERGEGVRERNSAILLDFTPRGSQPPQFLRATQRADKQKLVPFGEYIPFPALTYKRRELADWVRNTAGYLPAMTAGNETAIWDVELGGNRHKFSVNICYEVVFPEIFAEGRRNGAEFIVNTSNDAWYNDSNERDLCNAQIRFRAVENRLGILRLSNTGISTFVAPTGESLSNMLRKDEKGTLTARIHLGIQEPLAVEGGIWAERILFIMLVLAVFLGPRAKHK